MAVIFVLRPGLAFKFIFVVKQMFNGVSVLVKFADAFTLFFTVLVKACMCGCRKLAVSVLVPGCVAVIVVVVMFYLL